jgi:hypothetical protein
VVLTEHVLVPVIGELCGNIDGGTVSAGANEQPAIGVFVASNYPPAGNPFSEPLEFVFSLKLGRGKKEPESRNPGGGRSYRIS